MELTYHEAAEILDTKYFPTSSTRYTLPTGVYEIIDVNLLLRSLIPDDVEVKITIDDIRQIKFSN